MEAQRYPDDYDGIVAGAYAGIDWTALMFGELWTGVHSDTGGPNSALPQTQLNLVTNAVLKQCGRQDGGLASDAFLADPAIAISMSKRCNARRGRMPARV